ncbi:GTPase HflX [Candidatus Bipolaricaulota bacterium]|nr:GTPase HflX [Candidatus Bipolaricaulota bacterium]
MSDNHDPSAANQRLIEDHLGERARVYGTEQAVLVAIGTDEKQVEGDLNELSLLAETAGIPTLATVTQARRKPDPSTYVGKGKAEEVRHLVAACKADVVIFAHALSPAQARNLEDALKTKVIDRSQLILDIFAQRASTKEARLQVELAQLTYLLPRLRGWGHALTRLGGGIGTRGPGETQLEADRNKIRLRIHALRRDLKTAHRERALRRRRRERSPLPQIVLIGYTNSGKSTLLNALTSSHVRVEDQLFATLTTFVRRGEISPGREALFTDTVGFIRNLPHDLIPAFAATLEAAQHADLLLHVVDGSSPMANLEIESVRNTLEQEVFAGETETPQQLLVFNKCDLPCGEPDAAKVSADAVQISAKRGDQLDRLKELIAEQLDDHASWVTLAVPFAITDLLHREAGSRDGSLQHLSYDDHGAIVRARLAPPQLARLLKAGATIVAPPRE